MDDRKKSKFSSKYDERIKSIKTSEDKRQEKLQRLESNSKKK